MTSGVLETMPSPKLSPHPPAADWTPLGIVPSCNTGTDLPSRAKAVPQPPPSDNGIATVPLNVLASCDSELIKGKALRAAPGT